MSYHHHPLDDDDFVPPYDRYYHPTKSQSQPQRQQHGGGYRRPPLGSTNRDYAQGYYDMKNRWTMAAYFNGPNFGILMAILVIYIFHYKGGWGIAGEFLAAHSNESFSTTCMDLLLELQEYTWAYLQMAMEVARKVKHYLASITSTSSSSGDEWYYHYPSMYDSDDMALSPTSSTISANASGTGTVTSMLMSSTTLPRGTSSSAAGRTRGLPTVTGRLMSLAMPELEETDPLSRQQQQPILQQLQQKQAHASLDKENKDPLEPAFLRDEDYPPGWLVFDPVLGVVSKAEADKYRRNGSRNQPSSGSSNGSRQLQSSNNNNNNNHLGEMKRKDQQQPQSSPSQSMGKSHNNNNNTNARPLRTNHGMNSASAMHTPHTITANG